MSQINLKLGTRKSKLAWAQSSWVARTLEQCNPGLTVELVGITTQGDRIQDRPLQESEGKDFFVKELDDALLRKDVDLCVHSFKDLSLQRPSGIALAAVPKRLPMHDILFFKPGTQPQVSTLKIGSSAPRRMTNIPRFLAEIMPDASVEMVPIRGNINTRLMQLREDLDAVVLAACGLERLYQAEPEYLRSLIQDCPWILCPILENPTAPAQGALAIECRKDDASSLQLIGKIHDPASHEAVTREREQMAEWGGGCHQRFGISYCVHPTLGGLRMAQGFKSNNVPILETLLLDHVGSRSEWPQVLDGQIWQPPEAKRTPLHGVQESLSIRLRQHDAALFVSRNEALLDEAISCVRREVFCAGTSTWTSLVKRGVWVNGCAEGLGAENLWHTLRALSFLQVKPWLNLTHKDACQEELKAFPEECFFATYEVDYSVQAESLGKSRFLYWSSKSQYDSLRSKVPEGAYHACGPGKTAKLLGSSAKVFLNRRHWKEWIQS